MGLRSVEPFEELLMTKRHVSHEPPVDRLIPATGRGEDQVRSISVLHMPKSPSGVVVCDIDDVMQPGHERLSEFGAVSNGECVNCPKDLDHVRLFHLWRAGGGRQIL